LVYGVHLLSPDLLACTSGRQWNIHGGLSPWYRGSTTHFWPSYMLEPQMTGMTVHEITQAVDGGRIIHQLAAPLVAGDGLHDLACRTLAAFCEELPELIKRTADERLQDPQPQRTTGRIWRERDWRPDHLHLIYDFYGDRIVDRYLDGEFSQNPPRLIRQF
jgi:folate-dependent phosphoribosylglycinamide formyltransferase PurN